MSHVTDEPMIFDEPMALEPEVLPAEKLAPVSPVGDEQALAVRATDLVGRAKALDVDSPESFALADEMLGVLKDSKRNIEAWFKPDVDRAHDAWKGLTTKRASYVDPIVDAITALSARYSAYGRKIREEAEAERRRQEKAAKDAEEARLKAEADRLAAEAKAAEEAALTAETREEAIALETKAEEMRQEVAQVREEAAHVEAPVIPVKPTVTPAKGTSLKADWHYEIDDFASLIKAVAAGQVPSSALLPNETWLKQTARANKDTLKVAGVRFFDRGQVSHRRSR